jgi:thioredoxin 1
MKSTEITDSNFKEFITNDGISVVDFWAPWCGPCVMMGPQIDKLAESNPDVQIGKLNVDSNGTTAAAFGIRSIPTVIVFKDGEKVEQFSGVKQASDMQSIINRYK